MRRTLGWMLILCLGSVAPVWALTGGTNILVQNGTVAITGQIAVANGGTGASSLTAHGVLIGEGASAVVSVGGGTCTTGQALECVNSGNSDPAFTTLSTAFNSTVCFGSGMDLTTSFTTVYANITGGLDATEAKVQAPSPAATYGNLRCVSDATPGGSGISVTARVGACGSQANGTQTVTLTTANTAVADTTHNLVPTVNQCIDWAITNVGASITTTSRVNCCVERTA